MGLHPIDIHGPLLLYSLYHHLHKRRCAPMPLLWDGFGKMVSRQWKYSGHGKVGRQDLQGHQKVLEDK